MRARRVPPQPEEVGTGVPGRRVTAGRAAGLLVVLLLLLARLLPLGGQRPPSADALLSARLGYERALVADAAYQLGLTPHAMTVGQLEITIQPRQPDPQRAWDDAQHIEAVALDQPAVRDDLWQLHLAYQSLEHTALLYRQAHVAYTPDYRALQTWLDLITDAIGATGSLPAADTSDPSPGVLPPPVGSEEWFMATYLTPARRCLAR